MAGSGADTRAVVAHLGLLPLPTEGTFFKPTYRAADGACSAMLGLYSEEPLSHSLFHRLPVDEVWHFHGGDALRLVLLHPGGRSEDVILGPDVLAGQRVQFVVPAGTWQAGHWLGGGAMGWSLFGCTVVPAFDSTMFEGGTVAELLAGWPERARDIERLACQPGETAMPRLAGEASA
jgi:predicted cupin superfamily sugar epimerase